MSTPFSFSIGKLSRATPFPSISIRDTQLLRAFGPPVLVGISYYLGTRIGFAWTPPGQPNSTFWPPNAILLACMLLAPSRTWWTFLLALLPAHMLAQLQAGVPISTAVGWFISNTAEAWLGAFCITRFVDPRKTFDSVRGVLTFIVFAVVVAPFATSFLDAFAVVITGWGRSYWPLGLERFWTNALAVLTIVPTIVLFSRNQIFSSKRLTVAQLAELAVFTVATLSATIAIFKVHSFSAATAVVLCTPIPLLLWATVRYGAGGLGLTALTIALVSTWNVMQGREPFFSASIPQSILSLQILLCVTVVPLLFLSAVMLNACRSQARLLNITRGLIQAQEQERAHIARDLQDDVAQRLALVAAELEQFQPEIHESRSERRTRTNKLREEVIQISNTVHAVSYELHPSKLTYIGLVSAAKSFCSEVSERHEMKIRFAADSLPDFLPGEISICLFRVMQEAVHNAIKHSGAESIEVQLRTSPGKIDLIVSDSGKGFDANEEIKDAGLGLASMEERLKVVGGQLSIVSQPQPGTTIHARVPFDPTSDSASMMS